MTERGPTRRRFLCTIAAGATAVAGCKTPGSTQDPDEGAGDVRTSAPRTERPPSTSRYTDAYRAVVDAVASVRIYGSDGTRSQGSAFVYDDEHVVTNAHVVQDTDRLAVRFDNSEWIPATAIGADVYSDLAVLEPDQLPDAAGPLSFVDTEPPVGTEVVAVGNPFGFSGTVSTGIVSGTDRNLTGPNDFSIPDTVQTDAPVNPGNSGGPLVTLDADVVGVVNAGGGDNLGFAISAALTQRVVPDLVATGRYEHSYMGVRLQDVTPLVAQVNDLDIASGVYVGEVVEGGPSEGVLQGSTGERTLEGVSTPVGGDVIRTMGGRPIQTRQALSTFLALETRPGDTIPVGVERDGRRVDVELTLGERPDP